MKFVIAEKTAVAKSLAAVLGADEKRDGYLEGNGYIVSWCVGHLLELAEPQAYDERYAKWRYEDLPILPETWKYDVPKDKKKVHHNNWCISEKIPQKRRAKSISRGIM